MRNVGEGEQGWDKATLYHTPPTWGRRIITRGKRELGNKRRVEGRKANRVINMRERVYDTYRDAGYNKQTA